MTDKAENSSVNQHVPQIRQIPLIWLRKMATIFLSWDLDKDGVVGYDDFMSRADKIIQIGCLPSKACDDLIELFRDTQRRTSDNPNLGFVAGTSLYEQLTGLWESRDDSAAMDRWCNLYSDVFKIFDTKSAGFLTFEQYMAYWDSFELDKRFARMQFDYMNTNQDGKLTNEEFNIAYRDYLMSTDEDTHNRFFGPLIIY
ncbi:unnamed protein product [Owenia fusiformis]|uniref:Uncharacterized protein n=1 Tax=Owenia fusiformis TaxID=6347 RepID=A0A8S4PU50_OWEFU|nr:unnamed protein product [Owenia fusiformis]